MITKEETQKDKLSTQFDKYRSELRINNLEFEPLADPEEQFFTNFDAQSQGADLTFLGLKKPEETTTLDEYREYFASLLESTKGVNNIAYVLCGEKVEFRKIFRD